MRYLSIAALLLALAAPAWGQSDQNFDIVVYRDGILYHYTGIVEDGSSLFPPAPIQFAPIDLGKQQFPWNHVYAQGYSANGQPGLTINVPLGNGCLLHFQGGLLVAVTGGFFGSCGQ